MIEAAAVEAAIGASSSTRHVYVSRCAMPSTLRPALSVSGSQDETAAGAEMLLSALL